jgi:anti-sigma-K factor RskA
MRGEMQMSRQSAEEVLMRNYLLSVLDEEEQEQVEERLLVDEGFARRLSTAQDHLIDDYVFDALSEIERESFEKNFIITDERRKKMLLARTLEVYVDERYRPQPAQPDNSHLPSAWWRNLLHLLRSHKAWIAVPAIVLLLFFLTPKIFRWTKPLDPIANIQSQRANIERQIAELNKRSTDQRVQALSAYELALQPTQLREDGGIKSVTLTSDIKLLALKLALPQVKREKYSALVLTVEGDELFAVEELTPETDAGVPVVLLKIPSEFLITGDDQVQLRGVAAPGQLDNPVRYNFRVIK